MTRCARSGAPSLKTAEETGTERHAVARAIGRNVCGDIEVDLRTIPGVVHHGEGWLRGRVVGESGGRERDAGGSEQASGDKSRTHRNSLIPWIDKLVIDASDERPVCSSRSRVAMALQACTTWHYRAGRCTEEKDSNDITNPRLSIMRADMCALGTASVVRLRRAGGPRRGAMTTRTPSSIMK